MSGLHTVCQASLNMKSFGQFQEMFERVLIFPIYITITYIFLKLCHYFEISVKLPDHAGLVSMNVLLLNNGGGDGDG